MTSDNYELIRTAIAERYQVMAKYRGLQREMCPHILGRSSGREQCLVFQFGGASSKGLPPGGGWRCMAVARLESVEVVEGRWHTREDYRRPHPCVEIVDVAI